MHSRSGDTPDPGRALGAVPAGRPRTPELEALKTAAEAVRSKQADVANL